VTSPASGAGSPPDLPDYAPTTRSAQSETGRAASPAATAGGGNRRLGLALLVIATAQLMVVLDATIVNVALPHIQQASGEDLSSASWQPWVRRSLVKENGMTLDNEFRCAGEIRRRNS
jgi:hypothetical protein